MLKPARQAQIASLSWSPCGRMLAGAHGNAAGFTVWDVALGVPTTLSAGEHVVAVSSQ